MLILLLWPKDQWAGLACQRARAAATLAPPGELRPA
uniref:Uncharacterized protein n=1 Tax=Arundo donax TaxID=35708 RepID=A0A0A8Y2U3_ARUDO